MAGLLHGSEKFEVNDSSSHWLRLTLPETPGKPAIPCFNTEAARQRIETITIEELAAALERVYEIGIAPGADPKNYIAELKGADILLGQSLTYTNITHRLFRMTLEDLRTIWMEYENYLNKQNLMSMELSYDPQDWFDGESFSSTTSGILYFMCITGVMEALGIAVEGTNLEIEMPTSAFVLEEVAVEDDGWEPRPIPTIANPQD